VLGILGKGDFFGDSALVGNRPHHRTIRARTPVRLRQLGSALFSEVASTFLPLRELLAAAALRRSKNFWARVPLEKSVLENEPLTSLVEPLPENLLQKDMPLLEVINALSESPTGQLLIVDEKRRLWGSFDRDDMDQILAQIAAVPQDQRGYLPQRKLSDFLPANPLCVTLDDSTLTASMTLLDHGKPWLPVVQGKDDFRPVGYVRGERIVNRIIEKLTNRATYQASAAKANDLGKVVKLSK
jgi:NADH dehydrogenase